MFEKKQWIVSFYKDHYDYVKDNIAETLEFFGDHASVHKEAWELAYAKG